MVASAYNELVKASSLLADIDLSVDVDRSTIDVAAALLERIRPVLASVRATELQRCEVPVHFNSEFWSYHVADVMHLKSLSRALSLASEIATFQGDDEGAVEYGVMILDLANAVRRGGLVIDHLIAIGISDCGVERVRKSRDRFADPVRRRLIDALVRNEREREPYSEISERDKKWELEAGFKDDGSELSEDEMVVSDSELSVEDQKLMIRYIKSMASAPEPEKQERYDCQEQYALAITRLLSVDLALRCWKDRNGSYPVSIGDLAPDILPIVPRDPFTGEQFIYHADLDSFSLYSTGPDKIDRGGSFAPWPDVFEGGYDLCLDAQDYCPDCFRIPHRPGTLGRLWARLRFWGT